MSRYRFIAAHQASYPIAVLCRVLGVARSGYSAWRRRGVSARQQADRQLTEQIGTIHQQSRQTYGSPRVHAALRQAGARCGRKRVAGCPLGDDAAGRADGVSRPTTHAHDAQ